MRPAGTLCFVAEFENLGDAFLARTEARYLRRARGTRTTICTNTEVGSAWAAALASDDIGTLTLDRNETAALRAAARSDVVIGGGLLIREDVSRRWLTAVTGAALVARLTGHRVVVAGSGATPLQSARARREWERLLRLCHAIHLRDADSARNLAESVPRLAARIDVTDDVAYLPVAPDQPGSPPGASRFCLVAPAHDPIQGLTIDPARIAVIVEAIVSVGLADAVEVIAHDERHELDGDYCQRLVEDLRGRMSVPVHLAAGPVDERLVAAYARAEVVVTARLHGLILASTFGIRTAYFAEVEPKLGPFAERFAFPPIPLNAGPVEVQKVVQQLRRVEVSQVAAARQQAQARAAANFAELGISPG